MPTVNKAFSLEISVEQFLKQCSVAELHEVDMLMQSNWVQDRMIQKKQANHLPNVVSKHDFSCSQCPNGGCAVCPHPFLCR